MTMKEWSMRQSRFKIISKFCINFYCKDYSTQAYDIARICAEAEYYNKYIMKYNISNKDNVPWYYKIPRGIPAPVLAGIEPGLDDFDIYNEIRYNG